MSIVMDFSDQFKSTSGGSNKHKVLGQNTVNFEFCAEVENQKPSQANSTVDSIAFIKKSLMSLNLYMSTAELTENAVKTIEGLLSERTHWQNQASLLSEESNKLRLTNKILTQEKEKEIDNAEAARKNENYLNNKISALTSEHREVRNHWLKEKSDLESRLFQVQALNTQIAATLKKKEKDFEKLQNQFAKVVKDTQKVQKSVIQVSVPLKKNLSQSSSSAGANENKSLLAVLKDAEVIATRNTSAALEAENRTLRSALSNFQTSMQQLHEKFEHTLLVSEATNQANVEGLIKEHSAVLREKDVIIDTLSGEGAAYKERIQAITQQYRDITLAHKNVPTTPAPASKTDTVKAYLQGTPSAVAKYIANTPGTIAKKYLEGTPGAKPVAWMVEQTNTEVKRLRARADDISHLKATQHFASEHSGNTFGENGEISSESGFFSDNNVFKTKFLGLKAQLSEAMVVIAEQDRLIHEALLGKLPSSCNDLDRLLWEEEENAEERGDCALLDSVSTSITTNTVPTATTTAAEENNEFLFKDSDFLPPASPATFALLESYGWQSIPRDLSISATGSGSNTILKSIQHTSQRNSMSAPQLQQEEEQSFATALVFDE